ncbi:hypothetical protein ACFLRA_03090 [Bdellovibrionota bacterium]
MLKIKLILAVLVSLTLISCTKTYNPSKPEVVSKTKHEIRPEFKEARERAIQWLKSKIVPNETVKDPLRFRKNLVLSYEITPLTGASDEELSFLYLYNRISTYDNALSAIALTMVQEYETAEKILDSLIRLVDLRGRIFFSYNTKNSWPRGVFDKDSMIRNGASAWVGYAFTFYLRARLLEDPDFFKKNPKFTSYLKIANRMAKQILKYQVKRKKDPRYGLFTGGENKIKFVKDPKTGKITETWEKTKIKWVSIEHNIDIYFFLRDLAFLSDGDSYKEEIDLLKTSLLKKSFNPHLGQFNRGMRKDGPDPVRALDTASWGAMFALTTNELSKAEQCLNSTKFYLNKSGTIWGYKPYIDLLIYEDPKPNRAAYPEDPKKNWNDIEMVWSEGSLGVAMGALKMNQRSKAEKIIEQILPMQNPNGGVSYSTVEIKYQFTKAPSASGTAWLIMAISALEDDRVKELFW